MALRSVNTGCHARNPLAFSLIGVLFSAALHTACSAHESTTPANWLTDCVGRMQISLPGKVDVAANSYKTLKAEYKIGSQAPWFEFADGEAAGYSGQHYHGEFLVSLPLTPAEQASLLEAGREGVAHAQAYAKRKKKDEEGDPLVFEKLSVAPHQGHASHVNTSYSATVALGDHIVLWSNNARKEDADWARKSFDKNMQGLAPRPFGELPRTQGVCFPFAFVKDSTFERRSIGTTYRLQDHPDVTIWLEDRSASDPTGAKAPSRFTAEYRTWFFWKQDYQARKAWHSIWPSTRKVHMDGREGLESFVALEREDNTKDFGYLAVVQGDPKAKTDESDLTLSVIRTAKNAVDRKLQPMEQEAFLKMAQQIAASVNRRPVQ